MSVIPTIFKHTLCAGALTLGTAAAHAAVRLPAVFSDHMVLQRAAAVPVWGWADAGEAVHVKLGEASGSTRADANGTWQVILDLAEVQDSGPYVMTVSGRNRIEINDVLIGQVWLASGQSNMFWPLRNSNGGSDEIRKGAGEGIREFQVTLAGSDEPQQDLQGKWVVAEAGKTENFSAVAYFFASQLHAELQQPVGIIHSSWGGSSAEAWMRSQALAEDKEIKTSLDRQNDHILNFEANRATFAKELQAWVVANGLTDRAAAPASHFNAEATDTVGWTPFSFAEPLAQSGQLPEQGVIWFRRAVEVPPAAAGKDLIYHIRKGHGFATFYWNGNRFQGPEQWHADEQDKLEGQGNYSRVVIPGAYVKEGNNTLAVRCYLPLPAPDAFGWRNSVDGEGGFSTGLDTGWLAKAETRFTATEDALAAAPVPVRSPDEIRRQPSRLYNAMIAPLIPYRIAGVIWYQGETNTERATQYRRTFPMLIEDWRSQWQEPQLPFYFCQLANYGAKRDTPQESAWAELREAQSAALSLPATGQAVLIDIGEADDIHPRNKAEAGRRLAQIALARNYGRKDLIASGPVCEQKTIDGNTVYLTFKDEGRGSELTACPLPERHLLRTYPGPQTAPLRLPSAESELQGFAICSADGKWVWANARIDGTHRVAVWSDQVNEPIAVRYAWADNPTCNLYNAAGLPAAPFRTDDFAPITINGRF